MLRMAGGAEKRDVGGGVVRGVVVAVMPMNVGGGAAPLAGLSAKAFLGLVATLLHGDWDADVGRIPAGEGAEAVGGGWGEGTTPCTGRARPRRWESMSGAAEEAAVLTMGEFDGRLAGTRRAHPTLHGNPTRQTRLRQRHG